MNALTRRASRRRRARRSLRWTFWIVLACGPLGIPAEPARGQSVQLPLPGGAPEDDESTEAPDNEPERPPAVPADEPEEVTAGRLVALPIAAQARLFAVQEAVARRRAEGAAGVYVGFIHDEIELGIAYYTERVVREAERANAALLIFELETPGGRVDAAVMMRDYILESEVPTVAFVNRRAISAGALISLGNDLIIGAEGSSIGAATPWIPGGGGQGPPEEKMLSVVRTEFRAAAEATGRSPDVAEAMVDPSLAVGGISDAGRLLTLTGNEMVNVGLAEAQVDDRDELLDLLGVLGEPVTEIEESWAESLVRILTSSTVSGLLMSLGMLGLLFELMSPGFGWAGAMGLACLALFFAGHLLVNLAGSEEILLFLLGVVLLGVELFLIPGFGVTGAIGLVAIGASLMLALINLDIDVNLSPVGFSGALWRVAISMAGTIVGAYLIFKFVPRTALGRRLVLSEALAAGPSISDSPLPAIHPGDSGVATTDLRPFGKARIAGLRVEVVAESGLIRKGTPLRVSRVAESRVEVRADAPTSEDDTP